MRRRSRIEPGWTPLRLGSKLLAWWDAEDTTYIRSGGAAATDGSLVDTWTDKIQGISCVQATSSFKPVYRTSEFFGRPAVVADGADDFLLATTTGSLPSGSAESETWMLARNDAGAENLARVALVWGGSNSSTAMRIGKNGTDRPSFFVGTGASNVSGAGHDNVTPKMAVRGRYTSGLVEVGVPAVIHTIAGGFAATASIGTGTVRIGASSASTNRWMGPITQLLVTQPLTTDEAKHMRSWLQTKGL